MFSTLRKEGVKDFFTFAFIPLFAFTTVLLIPFIMGVVLTFTNWNGFTIGEFVGFQNYINAVTDESFIKIFSTTLKYVFFCLVFTNVIGFGLALLITSGIKGQKWSSLSLLYAKPDWWHLTWLYLAVHLQPNLYHSGRPDWV